MPAFKTETSFFFMELLHAPQKEIVFLKPNIRVEFKEEEYGNNYQASQAVSTEDDLVQKGYGWMLKAASEAYQKELFDFVVSHRATMPRTALRYAIEKMPQELRKEAMKKE